MRVVLEVTDGPQKGMRFVFEEHRTFVVGRSVRAHFQIPDDGQFSRHHFMVEVNPPTCFLRDLKSLNGTHVNGEKVEQARLADGDEIRGGQTRLKVHIEEKPEARGQRPEASRPVPDARRPTPDARLMGTILAGRRGELRCACCGEPAEDSVLRDLAHTGMVTYVCPKCKQERWDPRQPIPGFELIAAAGEGALGPVYKARRTADGRVVLLKVIAPRIEHYQEAAKLFFREMHLTARLTHPNIVPVVEMGQAGRDLWIATDFVEGVDAAHLAAQLGGRVPLRDAVDIVVQVLDALDYAHSLNLVHRDVKPSNIMVSGAPGSYMARLADFGLVRNIDDAGLSGITREGDVRGTVPFMPPEQVLDCRFVKPAGDIYQAGATLYYLLTGEFAHDFDAPDRHGRPKDPFNVILEDPIVPIERRNPSVPPAVRAVVEGALRHDPEDRFASAAEMAEALRSAVR